MKMTPCSLSNALLPVTNGGVLPKYKSSNRLVQQDRLRLTTICSSYPHWWVQIFLFHWLTGQCASKVFENKKVLYLASFCTVMVTEGNNLLEYRASHLRNASGSGKGRDRQFKTALFSIPLHIIFWRQWNHTSTKQSERVKKQIQFVIPALNALFWCMPLPTH